MSERLDDQIDKIIEEIDDLDPSDMQAQRKLEKLSKKLQDLKDQIKSLRHYKDAAEEDATVHENRTRELSEEMDTLQERYRFAIRMLELGYGVSERDLEWVSNDAPEDAFRKLTKAVKRAVAQGDVDSHSGCAYAGACIAYKTGIAGTPCSAGKQLTHKGRFGGGTRPHINPVLHGSCTPGHCMPAHTGWIPAGESCQ